MAETGGAAVTDPVQDNPQEGGSVAQAAELPEALPQAPHPPEGGSGEDPGSSPSVLSDEALGRILGLEVAGGDEVEPAEDEGSVLSGDEELSVEEGEAGEGGEEAGSVAAGQTVTIDGTKYSVGEGGDFTERGARVVARLAERDREHQSQRDKTLADVSRMQGDIDHLMTEQSTAAEARKADAAPAGPDIAALEAEVLSEFGSEAGKISALIDAKVQERLGGVESGQLSEVREELTTLRGRVEDQERLDQPRRVLEAFTSYLAQRPVDGVTAEVVTERYFGLLAKHATDLGVSSQEVSAEMKGVLGRLAVAEVRGSAGGQSGEGGGAPSSGSGKSGARRPAAAAAVAGAGTVPRARRRSPFVEDQTPEQAAQAGFARDKALLERSAG